MGDLRRMPMSGHTVDSQPRTRAHARQTQQQHAAEVLHSSAGSNVDADPNRRYATPRQAVLLSRGSSGLPRANSDDCRPLSLLQSPTTHSKIGRSSSLALPSVSGSLSRSPQANRKHVTMHGGDQPLTEIKLQFLSPSPRKSPRTPTSIASLSKSSRPPASSASLSELHNIAQGEPRVLISSRRRQRSPDMTSASRPTSSWSHDNLNLMWSLNLTKKKLRSIPQYVFQRSNLRVLELSRNEIQELPREVKFLEHLHALVLDHNQISDLPVELAELNFLQILDVSHNHIDSLVDELSLPKNLAEVRLSDNRLRTLPAHLFSIAKRLQGNNLLTQLPAYNWKLDFACLEIVDLKQNALQRIPGSILRLQGLCRLDISKNKLAGRWLDPTPWSGELTAYGSDTQMPTLTENVSPNLVEMNCMDNDDLCFPPPEIVRRGPKKVAEYLHRCARFQLGKCLAEKIASLNQVRRIMSVVEQEPCENVEGHFELLTDATKHDEEQKYYQEALQELSESEAVNLEPNLSFSLLVLGTEGVNVKGLADLISALWPPDGHLHAKSYVDGAAQSAEPEEATPANQEDKSEKPVLWLKAIHMWGSLLCDFDIHGGAGQMSPSPGSQPLETLREKFHLMSAKGMNEVSTLFRAKASWHMFQTVIESIQHERMFKVHRGIFLVAWRVYPADGRAGFVDRELQSVSRMVREILRNSPNARIVIVPNVSDANVSTEQLRVQAKSIIGDLSEKTVQNVVVLEEAIETPLIVQRNPVEKFSNFPKGMDALFNALHVHVTSSPYYKELLPKYHFDLRERILSIKSCLGRKFISFDEFRDLATRSGVPNGEDNIRQALELLQDLGAVKYFGSRAHGMVHDLLRNTVFIDMDWIMTAVDCLFNTDATRLITYFADRDPSMAYLASVLVNEGILHSKMIPFIWPSLSKNERWTDIDPELIVCYWDAVLHPCIGTDRKSLECAHAACVGLGLAFVDDESVSPSEMTASEQILATSDHLRNLKDFNLSCGVSFLQSAAHLQNVIVPKLTGLSTWHTPNSGSSKTSYEFFIPGSAKPGFTHQICRSILPSDDHEGTMAIYERIAVGHELLSVDESHSPLSGVQNEVHECGVEHRDLEFVCNKHIVDKKKIFFRLKRSVKIALKRLPADPTSHVGFGALLTRPNSRQCNEMQDEDNFWSAFKRLPPKELSCTEEKPLYVEHLIVLYRISRQSHAIAHVALDTSISLGSGFCHVVLEKQMAKLVQGREKFERFLCYMLLSNADGVGHLRSLVLGSSSPEQFLTRVYEVFKTPLLAHDGEKAHLIGGEIEKLSDCLVSLDVSDNPTLKKIPVKELSKMKKLNSIACERSPQVYELPREVAKLGGTQCMEYLKKLATGSSQNTELQIIVIGNGEAGKSSLINCVTSKDGKSEKIDEDARTVGIDIKEWKPEPFKIEGESVVSVDPKNLTCRFFDLAGQAVYGSSNQFFLVTRALYIIAWRIISPSTHGAAKSYSATQIELESMIVNWMDSLQIRVPGARIVLVATHIDAVANDKGEMTSESNDQVNLQCEFVEKIVQRKLDQIREGTSKSGMAPIEVYLNGKSLQMNCLKGDGTPQLRHALIELAHKSPWWEEMIPKSYDQLRKKIDEIRKDKVWIRWEEYLALADACKIQRKHVVIATSFLNDMAVIKYFGNLGTLTEEGEPRDKKDILDNTVFICSKWIINGLKGLIRHDREVLMEYVQSKIVHESSAEWKEVMVHKKIQKQLNRLASYGICDAALVPFLWPDGQISNVGHEYWKWLKEPDDHVAAKKDVQVAAKKETEMKLWPSDSHFATSQDDYDRVLALLEGCDFVYRKVGKDQKMTEFVAPILLAQDGKIDPRSLSEIDCPVKFEYDITGVAPGFFDRLLVRIQKAYSHIEISKNTGIFFGRGLKAQVFLADNTDKAMSSAKSQSQEIVTNLAPSRPITADSPRKRFIRTSAGNVSRPFGPACRKSPFHRPFSNALDIEATRTKSSFTPRIHLLSDSNRGLVVHDTKLNYKLLVHSSTRAQQMLIAKEIKNLNQFFPGMYVGPPTRPQQKCLGDHATSACERKIWDIETEVSMMKDDTEYASKEPVQIRIVSMGQSNASRVKKLLSELDGSKNITLRLRISAGALDDEDRREEEEYKSERYMDVHTRVVLMCMEKFDQPERDAAAAGHLRQQLQGYEQDYGCVGQISSKDLLEFFADKASADDITASRTAESDRTSRPCKHPQKNQTNVCIECLNEEVDRLLNERKFECARGVIRQMISHREMQVYGRLHSLMPWHQNDREFIDDFESQIENDKRLLLKEKRTDKAALDNIEEQLRVLQQLRLMDITCRQFSIEAKEFDREYFSPERSQSHQSQADLTIALRDKFKDDVEKFSYCQKKYHLLWTRLELLKNLGLIERHLPDLIELIGRLKMTLHSITDQRKAYDAMKGLHQTEHKQQEQLQRAQEQKRVIEEVKKEMGHLNGDLKSLLEWMAFISEFQWHVRKGSKIIPLIMPGYFDEVRRAKKTVNYCHWWPDHMPAMEEHALFVDFTRDENLSSGVSFDQVSVKRAGQHLENLLLQIDTYLDSWRGALPDPQLFQPPDHIPCYMCVEKNDPKGTIHMFDREEVEQRLAEWRKEQLERVSQLEGQSDYGYQEQHVVIQCKVDQEHKLDATELLSHAVIFDAIPCPQCIKVQDFPPHSFNRKKCIEFFTEYNPNKTGTETCPKCEAAGRPHHFQIVDLIAAQVFFSYNWGKEVVHKDAVGKETTEYSTQSFVVPLCNRVELNTDLLVWLDVRGGMGVGENHKLEMLDGIQKAIVVVIFLSDAYVNSKNCQREFLNAMRASKYIIPVLVPPDRSHTPANGYPNSGWTGRYEENDKYWWRHIYDVITRDKEGNLLQYDPDQPSKRINWSFLGKFQPIDMRDAAAFEEGSKEEMTLIKNILGRFHRGAYIDHQTARKYSQWKDDSRRLSLILKEIKGGAMGKLDLDSAKMLFEKIDKDKSGEIDLPELQQFFQDLNLDIDLETAKKLMKEADADNSGTINVQELYGLITELSLASESSG